MVLIYIFIPEEEEERGDLGFKEDWNDDDPWRWWKRGEGVGGRRLIKKLMMNGK